MSSKQNEQGAAALSEHDHVHGPECEHDHESEHGHGSKEKPGIEPLTLEIEDLTPEGKANAEERLKRSIPDLPYTVHSSESRPGSILALTIEIKRADFLEEQTRMLEDLSREVIIPGFRKGKAPLKLLQIRMGEDAIRSTISALATNALRQEYARQNFDLVSKPRITSYVTGHGQEPVNFVAELEIMPRAELKEYKGLTVEVEERPLTDDLINERIEQLRQQNAVLENAPAGKALSEDDTAVVKTEVTNEAGEPLSHLSKPTQTIYNLHRDLPGPVAEQLLGKKVGDVAEADVPTKVSNRRGEEIEHKDHWRVEVLEIKTAKLPDLDDEFAKDLGEHDTLEGLRQKIRENLITGETDRQRGEAVGKLYRQIVEKNPIETPRSLLAHRQYELIMQDQQQLQRMGLRLDQVVTDTDKYLRDQRASADELVKIQMLTAELAKREGLEVSDEDVEKEIAAIAEQTGRKPLAVRARLEAQKQLDQFRQNVSRKKISDFLLANNTVNKVAPKPEDEIKNKPAENK